MEIRKFLQMKTIQLSHFCFEDLERELLFTFNNLNIKIT